MIILLVTIFLANILNAGILDETNTIDYFSLGNIDKITKEIEEKQGWIFISL